ncbi:MAG: PASTA domain-containing protein [Clostridiales bacterium]|nr:PASTA domain-containing protein [Clostridiales bacterium]
MHKPNIKMKKRLLFFLLCFEFCFLSLIIRVFYIQYFESEFLQEKAYEQQTRDRLIKPKRGDILDRNLNDIAKTQTVCSVSVIHAQITDEKKAAEILSKKLELDYDFVLKKIQKKVALERIKTKVDKELGDEIRELNIDGIVIDDDIKRVYPYSNLASQVIGFTGKDNQGIVGLEAKYDEFLKGEQGKILTETDAKGVEMKDGRESRIEPISGYNLVTSIDINLQQYAEQTVEKVVEAKQAQRGLIILMNPQNGEIYAMANKPDFDLNEPFKINSEELQSIWDTLPEKEKNDYLNKMWRNFAINDTYEPGSTFKVITSAAGLEEKAVDLNSSFNCGSGRTVAGRHIKCWRSPRSHGTLNFVQGVQNSCNPVFIDVAARLGPEKFYSYMKKFGFDRKTGIDLPGEAKGIMHKLENIGPVELATMSFGQSFQITPLQLLRAISSVINGGKLIVPHFGVKITDENNNVVKTFDYSSNETTVSRETSEKMKEILESVVSQGTGNKTYIPGYRIGGKTATSEKLPRRSGKYIASFMAFSPAENPQVIGIVLVDEPKGTYYGGQVAGPVMKELLSNVLPYLGIEPVYNDEEAEMPEVMKIDVPKFIGKKVSECKAELTKLKINFDIKGEGDIVLRQFPEGGEKINAASKIVLYTQN